MMGSFLNAILVPLPEHMIDTLAVVVLQSSTAINASSISLKLTLIWAIVTTKNTIHVRAQKIPF